MKTKMYIVAAIGFTIALINSGCNNAPDKKVDDAKENVNEARQNLEDAKVEYTDEWEKFKTESDQKIRDNENEIEKLKKKIEKADAKDKDRYNKKVLELESDNNSFKMKVNEYSSNRKNDRMKDKWEEFRENFNHDMDRLGKSIHDTFSDKEG